MMRIETRNRWFTRVGTAAIAAVALGALAVPLTPANAQYLGVDLGGGVGIGLGAPPSAYGVYPPYYHPPYYRPYYRPYYYPW